MKKGESFGSRMKGYEDVFRHHLPQRMPVIIRIDGTHFHTYTKGLQKPFDDELAIAFWETCKYLAHNIMGCKLVYHQSDEISLLLTNYDKLTTQSWFENNLQKVVSVSASLATAKFNEIMLPKVGKLATFDSRAWVLPQDEVHNYFLWRQNDATKNSISMVAQSVFPHGKLQGLNGSQMQDKLMLERNINWNDIPVWQKRGVCIRKQEYYTGDTRRKKWEVDHQIPIFSQDSDYINRYVYLEKSKEDSIKKRCDRNG
ncbi:tRNA(His) guanylyltransferase Thg1 family protein [Paenibacillus polymyxa]|uniref:tRNA(His) guanylyltransferase Thg1 family protein n=1 Tax=Paenibacillus polymyxa TaxID=1406 RepID=UPI0001E6C132|nr:tRNA(His) guanylyltransferase Thg1 family protein [Paenibacillus polymyxa]WPQ59780.1 tRNA(His) guanylyltransferase Thg1 family protein [Paenibacillus polymyxa]